VKLASLLQDVRKIGDDPMLDDGQAGRIMKWMMRAVPMRSQAYMLRRAGQSGVTDDWGLACVIAGALWPSTNASLI